MRSALNDEKRKKVRTQNSIDIFPNTTATYLGLNMDGQSENVHLYSSPEQNQISLNSKNKRKVGEISPHPLLEITNVPSNENICGTHSLPEQSYNMFRTPGKENILYNHGHVLSTSSNQHS
ncbi:hypothetical protein PIB30_033732 [Stylosanthes scabra]|uniref:Uncharacterized protein n=1 Tax=Stylosanthes scabra TaxID=79078 RepID=A0ABU6ZBW3_9FABA|nr:hypothetical protein [Stylosanthes scabra]